MTYQRLHHEVLDPAILREFRTANYKLMDEDRIRCQHCYGFYWRLWFDQAQCLACQNYTAIEVTVAKEIKVGLGVFTNFNNLLQVDWIREQLGTGALEPDGAFMFNRVKDPLSDRTEFIIFKDRLRCRVTSVETMIKPEIIGYWLIGKEVKVEGKILSEEEALELVRRRNTKESNSSGDCKIFS